MTGILFIPGIEAGDLSDKAAVDAALAGAIYWPAGTTTLCGIEVPGLLFALSASTALNPYPLALFGEGQSGALWRGTLSASLRAATDGTGEAALGGAIARINDSSGNALHLTQASTSLRPIRGRRPKTGVRNLVNYSQAFDVTGGAGGWGSSAITVTPNGAQAPDTTTTAARLDSAGTLGVRRVEQTLSLSAGQHTVSCYFKAASGSTTNWATIGVVVGANASYGTFDLTNGATGSVISGVAITQTVTALANGWYRAAVTFTLASAQSVTVRIGPATGAGALSTETGSGIYTWGAQCETGAAPTAYQARAAAYDIIEDGVESVTYAAFDLVDDALTTGAIAGGLTGQAFVAGDGGCYVSDLVVAAGGSFGIGGTSHNWTGAAPGILRAVTGNTGRVLDAMIREGNYTEDEILRLERYCRAQGGKGLLVPDGVELWTGEPYTRHDAGVTAVGAGDAAFDSAANAFLGYQSSPPLLTVGAWYLSRCTIDRVYGSFTMPYDGQGANQNLRTSSGSHEYVFRAISTGLYVGVIGAAEGSTYDISVQRLIPREDL